MNYKTYYKPYNSFARKVRSVLREENDTKYKEVAYNATGDKIYDPSVQATSSSLTNIKDATTLLNFSGIAIGDGPGTRNSDQIYIKGIRLGGLMSLSKADEGAFNYCRLTVIKITDYAAFMAAWDVTDAGTYTWNLQSSIYENGTEKGSMIAKVYFDKLWSLDFNRQDQKVPYWIPVNDYFKFNGVGAGDQVDMLGVIVCSDDSAGNFPGIVRMQDLVARVYYQDC